MIIGEGIVADRFIDYFLQDDFLLFAGSVHDSQIEDPAILVKEELEIESALLKHKNKAFVYFSTCSIQDPALSGSSYVQHKLRMEQRVKELAKKFYIFRLPNLVGSCSTGSNLINFLVSAVREERAFQLWQNAQRNLIDIDDVHLIVGVALRRRIGENLTINVANPHNLPTASIVLKIEDYSGLKAQFVSCDKGSTYVIDIDEIVPIIDSLAIIFDDNYLDRLLSKYYGYLIAGPKLLSVVVPTYNEEKGIDEFYRRTRDVLDRLSPRFCYEIIFINDASSDNTLQRLYELAHRDDKVKIVNFSRNFGNQIGITAGIDIARGDGVVIIDDDLQDPPEIILNFIREWEKGYKVVYGVRPKRAGISPLFKLTAKLYYRILNSLSDLKIPNDCGDFRLIDRSVVTVLKKMREENRYYRGMVAWAGFSQIGVIYDRDKRFAGVSTFSFKKYINFALNGLTSFTEKPLYFSSVAGLLITALSFIMGLSLIVMWIIDPSMTVRGWTSLAVIILFFGGVQLLSVGLLGIYISKIYREVKQRPLYVIEESINLEKD